MIPELLVYLYITLAVLGGFVTGLLVGWKFAKRIFTYREIERMSEAIRSIVKVREESGL